MLQGGKWMACEATLLSRVLPKLSRPNEYDKVYRKTKIVNIPAIRCNGNS